MSALLAVQERQLRAGARALRGLLSHPHPLARRIVNESLSDLTWNDLLRFTESCEAALVAMDIEPGARSATKVCTCTGVCRGAKNLGEGWHCAIEDPLPAAHLAELRAAFESDSRD